MSLVSRENTPRPKFTRRHYAAIAEAIKEKASSSGYSARIYAEALVPMFETDNENFDAERFYQECGI